MHIDGTEACLFSLSCSIFSTLLVLWRMLSCQHVLFDIENQDSVSLLCFKNWCAHLSRTGVFACPLSLFHNKTTNLWNITGITHPVHNEETWDAIPTHSIAGKLMFIANQHENTMMIKHSILPISASVVGLPAVAWGQHLSNAMSLPKKSDFTNPAQCMFDSLLLMSVNVLNLNACSHSVDVRKCLEHVQTSSFVGKHLLVSAMAKWISDIKGNHVEFKHNWIVRPIQQQSCLPCAKCAVKCLSMSESVLACQQKSASVRKCPGLSRCLCWIKRSICLVKQISLLETTSTAVLLANVVVVAVDLSRVFHAVDSAALQVTHRCTPAPYGTPAAPAALPTHSFGDVDPCLDSDLRTLC